MANKEYSSRLNEFWHSLAATFSVVPVLMVIGFAVTYFIGTFRPDYIRKYNKAVEPWLNGGREAFDNNNFTIVDSSGVEIFKKIDKVSGTYYPMRDSCHKPGDPKEGCKETGLLYYDEDFIWMKQKNHYILKDTDGSVILDNTIDGTLNYTRSAEKLGCTKHPEYCEERCDEMGGYWDVTARLCTIEVYADNICYRVVKKDGHWVLDKNNEQKLPQNKAFSMYPSDGLGCDYGNNWNSIHYGKTPISDVRVQIRSSLDSYLMASAYTRSCSNDNTLDKGCFGLTHFEEKHWCIIWIYISCGLIGVEILLYLLYVLIGKLKYRAAVKASEAKTADPLLNASVYVCLFKPLSSHCFRGVF